MFYECFQAGKRDEDGFLPFSQMEKLRLENERTT
jgi:hypothetical protein